MILLRNFGRSSLTSRASQPALVAVLVVNRAHKYSSAFRADVINLKPRVVHIMAGTNDIAEATGRETDEEIEGYISNMVELAQLHGIQVVLASIPPAADFFWHTGLNPAPRICALNNWLKAYALDQKLTYVDYWSVLSAPDGGMKRDFSDDGVHPNVNGYRAMEPLAEAAITKALQ